MGKRRSCGGGRMTTVPTSNKIILQELHEVIIEILEVLKDIRSNQEEEA